MGERPKGARGGAFPRSSFELTREDLATLSQWAQDAGLLRRRGVGAGRLGSVTALLASLAEAYRRDPEAARALVGQLAGEEQRG